MVETNEASVLSEERADFWDHSEDCGGGCEARERTPSRRVQISRKPRVSEEEVIKGGKIHWQSHARQWVQCPLASSHTQVAALLRESSPGAGVWDWRGTADTRQGGRHSKCSQRHGSAGEEKEKTTVGWDTAFRNIFLSFLFFEIGNRRLYYLLLCLSQPKGGKLNVAMRLGTKNKILCW